MKRSTTRRWRASSVERLTDDPTGELDRDLAHLGAELGDDLLALGLETAHCSRARDPVGLLLGLLRAAPR